MNIDPLTGAFDLRIDSYPTEALQIRCDCAGGYWKIDSDSPLTDEGFSQMATFALLGTTPPDQEDLSFLGEDPAKRLWCVPWPNNFAFPDLPLNFFIKKRNLDAFTTHYLLLRAQGLQDSDLIFLGIKFKEQLSIQGRKYFSLSFSLQKYNLESLKAIDLEGFYNKVFDVKQRLGLGYGT